MEAYEYIYDACPSYFHFFYHLCMCKGSFMVGLTLSVFLVELG